MNAEEIIRFIHDAKKATPVKAYVKAAPGVEFPGCRVFGAGDRASSSASGATYRQRSRRTPPPLRTWSSSATAATAPCRFWT